MSQVRIDSEDIAEIKNALQVIQWKAELIIEHRITLKSATFQSSDSRPEEIVEQVKRINKLLSKE